MLACSDPELNTDLVTEGPPEVTIVTVLSEGVTTFIPALGPVPEVATFCIDDANAKVHRDFCPDGESATTVMDAVPVGWYARIVFSELLNADMVEELIDTDDDGIDDWGTIANTQPVTLTCGGTAVAYDGFYDPSGNDVTFPPGPALVIQPTDFVATGTADCSVTIGTDVVEDKEGNTVSTDLLGPHAFGIAVMSVAGTEPAADAEGTDPTVAPTIAFNALVDAATITGQITINDGNTDIAATLGVNADDPTLVDIVADAGMLTANTTYTVTMQMDNTIADVGGGELVMTEDLVYSFTTGDVPPPME
jgi:hypothetical protein